MVNYNRDLNQIWISSWLHFALKIISECCTEYFSKGGQSLVDKAGKNNPISCYKIVCYNAYLFTFNQMCSQK